MLILSLLSILVAPAHAITAEDAQVILRVELERSPPLALAELVRSLDPDTRARAARALGRLRDGGAIAPLRTLAQDPQAPVRDEAAFALGQTPGAERVLLVRLRKEEDTAVRATLIEALGKTGEANAIPSLRSELHTIPAPLRPPLQARSAAMALGRIATRGETAARGPQVIDDLVETLGRADRPLREGAAFALSRMRIEAMSPLSRQALFESARTDPSPEVRALLVRATTTVRQANDLRDTLLETLCEDPDAGVRIAVARASTHGGWGGVTALLHDEDPGVRLEAIRAVGAIDTLDHEALLTPFIEAGATQKAAEAALATGDPRTALASAAISALATAGVLTAPQRWLAPTQPAAIRAATVVAIHDREALIALALDDGEAAVRTQATLALLDELTSAEALTLLGARDPMVSAEAAEWLSAHPNTKAQRALVDRLVTTKDANLALWLSRAIGTLLDKRHHLSKAQADAISEVLPSLLASPHSGLRHAAGRLSEAVGLVAAPLPNPMADLPMDEVLRVRTARVRTTHGEAIIDLLPQQAPVTVWNFVLLAESGAFDGLRFHRVVPDFVVQGGDPRGDGLGGPGWVIPDEINPVHFTTGTLGMALSAPDTGGSQWFVTLSDQPHLDGDYTAFGRVARGMHVFHEIMPGDRIEQVIIERAPE